MGPTYVYLVAYFVFPLIKPAMPTFLKFSFIYSYQDQVKAETARHLSELATGVVKVLPEGQIRLGPVGAVVVKIAYKNFKQYGTTISYFPKQDLFVVIRQQK